MYRIEKKLSLRDLARLINKEIIRKITVDNIIDEVLRYRDHSREVLYKNSREREYVLTRQIIMYLCRSMTNETTISIGRRINKDHSTVLYSCKSIKNLIAYDKNLKNDIKNIVGKFSK